MNKGQKVVIGLLGAIVAELAVADIAIMKMMRNGVEVEISTEELIKDMEEAEEVAEEDMREAGEL